MANVPLVEWEGHRQLHYALLSRLFAEEIAQSDLRSGLAGLNEDKDGVLVPLMDAVEQAANEPDADTRVRVEFAHLFLLPEGVKPFASVYLGDEPLLMQEPWVAVRQFYSQCGWKLEQGELIEDHVSVELAFMAHLSREEASLSCQESFFFDHLCTWIPQLFKDIIDNEYSSFYEGVAQYGLLVLDKEREFFRG